MVDRFHESAHTYSVMGLASAIGLLLAIVICMGAVLQVDALQDISKPITTGSLNSLIGTTTFIMLLVAAVVALFALGGAVMWALRR